MTATQRSHEFIRWLEEVDRGDVACVGGKNASLGEMIRHLAKVGACVPDGFATTAVAYREYIRANHLQEALSGHLTRLERGQCSLADAGGALRSLILESEFPAPLRDSIVAAYRELGLRSGLTDVPVAVRSSATAEDLPEASFAGQQESFLNVRGERALLDACRRCYASLFTDRAISYRQAQGFGHLDVALSIGIQRMVRSDTAGAGVMFSIDPETGYPGVVSISAAWGLGESVVQGLINPDRYLVFKPGLTEAYKRPILQRVCGDKHRKMVYAEGGSCRVRSVNTTRREREQLVLSDDEVLQLARWCVLIESHFGRPMDVEWAKDGDSGELFIVQARPETVQSRQDAVPLRMFRFSGGGKGRCLASGIAIGQSIAAGPVCLIRSAADIGRFRPGSILVTEVTDPDWVPVMQQARGIVTDQGGSTSHAAIISRELGVPAIVGCRNATDVLADGADITMSCAEGETGFIYAGLREFETVEVDVKTLPETRTAMMINLAAPEMALQWWRLPTRGVGLARMEFIIDQLIRVHPMALLHPDRVTDVREKRQIMELLRRHGDAAEYFEGELARGIARLAAPFYPRPVVVRLSDFKTSEYAHLIGGSAFEPPEENPMLGFRGAARYYSDRYREGFAMECRALRRVREVIGLDNVIVMVPFCRTPEEAQRVLEEMARHGLQRGGNDLQVYMMCELPSNVILAEIFAPLFDGFSIGSNDLTQLILGVDRDSAELAPLFDERHEAVRRAILVAIREAHAAGIVIGICGQAPSNYPDFTTFLVQAGIDSISLNPDSFVDTLRHVAAVEARMDQAAG